MSPGAGATFRPAPKRSAGTLADEGVSNRGGPYHRPETPGYHGAVTSWVVPWVLVASFGLDDARRATELAFRAELAGDYAGARRALEGQVAQARGADSEAARAWLTRHLAELDRRATLQREYGDSAEGYLKRLRTLRNRPARWRSLLWSEARKDLPELDDAVDSAPVRFVWDRLEGLSRPPLNEMLSARLERAGIPVAAGPGPAVLQAHLHASTDGPKPDRHRFRVEVEASYVLRETKPRPASIGARQVRHEEVRRDADRAVQWTARRAMDELSKKLVHDLRVRALEELAGL